MSKVMQLGLAVLFVATQPLMAQSLPDTTGTQPRPKSVLDRSPAILLPTTTASPGAFRFWARGEYLLWWVKNAPMPVPIVTTGDPNVGFNGGVGTVNIAGASGQPGTRTLFGDSNVGLGAFSGMRFTLGGWLSDEQIVGIEGSAFILERRSSQFAAAGDGTNGRALYYPINSTIAGAPRGIPIADPLRQFTGAVFTTSALQLWGAELNGCINLTRRPGFEIVALGGFRYADLRESFQIRDTVTDLLFQNVQSLNDNFDTRNQFYGGQLGLRSSWQRDRLSVDLTGKVALGSTHQVVNIAGSFAQNPLLPPSSAGGLFTQSSNIGRTTANQFTVIPSVDLTVGYQVSQRLTATVGYNFMHWNQVVRPGNQIDRNVNLTQNGVLDPNGVGALVGPAQPTSLFNRTDFWAQGVSFGLVFRY